MDDIPYRLWSCVALCCVVNCGGISTIIIVTTIMKRWMVVMFMRWVKCFKHISLGVSVFYGNEQMSGIICTLLFFFRFALWLLNIPGHKSLLSMIVLHVKGLNTRLVEEEEIPLNWKVINFSLPFIQYSDKFDRLLLAYNNPLYTAAAMESNSMNERKEDPFSNFLAFKIKTNYFWDNINRYSSYYFGLRNVNQGEGAVKNFYFHVLIMYDTLWNWMDQPSNSDE